MTDLQETLRRLARRFVAQDIMKPRNQLVCADSEADAPKRLQENPPYDIIPILSGGKVLAFLERGQPRRETIQIQHLVGAATPILDLVDTMSERRFVFVLGRHEVIGLIQFSDLNDPVVKLPFFVLLEGVERRLVDALQGLVTEDVIPELIRDAKRVDAIRKKMAKLQDDKADRDWVTPMYFREILEAAVHFRKVSLEVVQIEELSAIRNRVVHAAREELIERHGDVKRLSLVRHLCMSIMLEEPVVKR
jgi:hypothetical protein